MLESIRMQNDSHSTPRTLRTKKVTQKTVGAQTLTQHKHSNSVEDGVWNNQTHHTLRRGLSQQKRSQKDSQSAIIIALHPQTHAHSLNTLTIEVSRGRSYRH